MYRKVAILIAVVVALGASASFADEMGMLGRNEVSFAAAYADVADINVSLIAAHYGRFVTPNLEAQLGLFWVRGEIEDDSASGWGLAPAVAWHFVNPKQPTIVPYVGLGWYFVDSDDFGLSENGLEAFVGGKFFINGDYKSAAWSIFAEYRYLNDVFDENVSLFSVGITNFF